MKTMMIAGVLALMTTGALAGTVTREGPNGTSITTRSAANGVATSTETWTGKNGGVYQRTTVCEDGRCNTGWTLTDRKGRMSSGERDTIFGQGQSTTTATTRGFGGETRTRTINRTRSISR